MAQRQAGDGLPQDLKYGRVTLENKDIPEHEPVVVFRAKDYLAANALAYYLSLLESHGLGDTEIFRLCKQQLGRFQDFQAQHADIVRLPD